MMLISAVSYIAHDMFNITFVIAAVYFRKDADYMKEVISNAIKVWALSLDAAAKDATLLDKNEIVPNLTCSGMEPMVWPGGERLYR